MTIRIGDIEGDGTSNFNCGNGGHDTVAGGATIEVACDAIGRFVNIRIPGADKYLTLCEVEVYARHAAGNVGHKGNGRGVVWGDYGACEFDSGDCGAGTETRAESVAPVGDGAPCDEGHPSGGATRDCNTVCVCCV